MNTFLWILIVSVAVNHEQVFAKMNRGPGLHENKCCNAPKSSSHTEFVEKMKGFMQTCRQELGITGKYSFSLPFCLFIYKNKFNCRCTWRKETWSIRLRYGVCWKKSECCE